eukprot:c23272_g1_i1 orf=280-822(+)
MARVVQRKLKAAMTSRKYSLLLQWKTKKLGRKKSLEEKKANPEGRKAVIDFEALSRHGYSGSPSVLYVPPPRSSEAGEQDWSWSSGRQNVDNEEEESIEQHEQTRRAANDAAVLAATRAIAEHDYAKMQKRAAAIEQKNLSYARKEKRKRDFGQSSRGKNYVEEEKRLLRDQGIYSGFDT